MHFSPAIIDRRQWDVGMPLGTTRLEIKSTDGKFAQRSPARPKDIEHHGTIQKYSASVDILDDHVFVSDPLFGVVHVNATTGKTILWPGAGNILFLDSWPGKRVVAYVCNGRRDVLQLFPSVQKYRAGKSGIYFTSALAHSSILNPECTVPEDLVSVRCYEDDVRIIRGVRNISLDWAGQLGYMHSNNGCCCPHEKVVYSASDKARKKHLIATAQTLDSMLDVCSCACEMFRQTLLIHDANNFNFNLSIYDTRANVKKLLGRGVHQAKASQFAIVASNTHTYEAEIYM